MSEETKEKPIVDDTKQGLKLKSKPKKLVDKMPNNITHTNFIYGRNRWNCRRLCFIK